MTGVGPTSEHAPSPGEDPGPPASPAMQRAMRMSFANMLRSLLPLVAICLLIVGWQAFRSSGDVGVRTVDPSSTVQLAAARASYELQVPTGLDEGYRSTSARTDAGAAEPGDPVTLEIGYLTPEEEFGVRRQRRPCRRSGDRRPRRGGGAGDGRPRREPLDPVDDGEGGDGALPRGGGGDGRGDRFRLRRRAGDRRGVGAALPELSRAGGTPRS